MSKTQKKIAMIPARIGSERLPKKNLRILNGKPLVYYALNAATLSGVFDEVYLNGDHEIFEKIAREFGVKYHHREIWAGASDASADDVVAEFLNVRCCDIVSWVNPVSPLQSSSTIKRVIEHFIAGNFDSLITSRVENFHALFGGDPINFNFKETFSKTQDLSPVEILAYTTMVWRADVFAAEYKKTRAALFCGKFSTYPVPKTEALAIKNIDDILAAEALMMSKSYLSTANQLYK